MDALSKAIAELRTNKRQWEAFCTRGHCVVLAPPGSGKTKLLTTRVAFDLTRINKPPHGAACITLTNAAADELERRLRLLGVEYRSTLFVGTLHAFALAKIIVPFAVVAGRPGLASPKIATERQTRAAMDQAIAELYAESERRFLPDTVARLRRMMDADAVRLAGGRIATLISRFEELLHAEGVIDFDDIVIGAVHLVEENEFVRRALAARYPYLYVDEYQDLAPGLDRLVRALCFDYTVNSDLFAVGDADQSIFGWTGSRPELLDELATRPGVHPVRLNINYRSAREIIEISARALGETREVEGLADGGSVTGHYVPEGFEAQIAVAARLIRERVAVGTPYDEIAVLCAWNTECRQVADALRAAGIPAFVRDDEVYRSTPATSLVEGLAAWATLPRGRSGHSLGTLLRRWRSFVRDADVDLMRLLLAFKTRKDDAATAFLGELDGVGFGEALRRPEWGDERNEMLKLRRAVDKGQLAGLTVAGLAERARAIDRVYVTTMTSSKGLEFDVVLLLGMEEGKIPFFKSTGAELAEDRRKFYVSLTRARREVHILYSGWVRWKSGKTSEAGPSRFVLELGLPEH